MEALYDVIIDVRDEYTFMIRHEKNKIKEVNKTIKKLIKVNENNENKVDLETYFKERDEYLKNLTELKHNYKKITRIYKILINE